MNACNYVLIQLLAMGPEKTYSYYTKREDVDHFIRILLKLSDRGLVQVYYKSWSWGGDRPFPKDVVPSGITLTRLGTNKAERLKKVFLAHYKDGGGDM